MNIYFAHSKRINYQNLYNYFKKLSDMAEYNFILPHFDSDKPFDSLDFFQSGDCNLVLAEVSNSATGLGIELGWASLLNIPIIAIYQDSQKPSSSIRVITKYIFCYKGLVDLENILMINLQRFKVR
jgi:hypothetical protein